MPINSKTILAISLVAVFAVAIMFGQSALAKGGHLNDKKDAAPDFDIRKAGIDKNGNPFIKVTGTVCGTASNGLLFAYILVTDDGTYVIATHGFIDDDEQTQPAPDLECHAHKVTSVDTNSGCVTGVSFTGEEVVLNAKGDEASITGTAANVVSAAVTAVVDLSTGQVCPVTLDTA